MTSFDSVFGITAWNPLAIKQSTSQNTIENEKLEKDLESKCEWYFNSAGFSISEDWCEHGFIVKGDSNYIIELARKYNQGAIYTYKIQEGLLFRKTVSILIKDVDTEWIEMFIIKDKEIEEYFI